MVFTPFAVSRYNFFPSKGGATLRFTEHSPPRQEHNHSVCNCTQNVAERPEGKPSSVNTVFQSEETIGGKRLEVNITKSSVDFTFRWEDPAFEKSRAHAYFWFSPEDQKLKVEITRKGCGIVDCFFADLKPDESGKSLTCSNLFTRRFGEFSQEIESNAWLIFINIANGIHRIAKHHLESGDSVDSIRESLNTDLRLITSFLYESKKWLVKMLDTLETTEMFKLGVELDKENR